MFTTCSNTSKIVAEKMYEWFGFSKFRTCRSFANVQVPMTARKKDHFYHMCKYKNIVFINMNMLFCRYLTNILKNRMKIRKERFRHIVMQLAKLTIKCSVSISFTLSNMSRSVNFTSIAATLFQSGKVISNLCLIKYFSDETDSTLYNRSHSFRS